MAFRLWEPDTKMERGIWNIPVPAAAPPITPDVVIAPLVGFDRGCYRLGYGGGYFDRTLAAFAVRPLTVGVGYSSSELTSIRPQTHDIPMHMIVTENRLLRCEPAPSGQAATAEDG